MIGNRSYIEIEDRFIVLLDFSQVIHNAVASDSKKVAADVKMSRKGLI